MNDTPFGPQGTMIGKMLGDYQLLELLTSGGMARIYKGIDVRLQRYAAVKVLMRELLDSDETLPERFQREARAVAQLDHPNIVNVYQTGEQDGYMFIAMRLIEGNDLADEITRLRRLGQMMEPKRALAILEQVADALDYAHARGIIHRDFKPSNVLLDAQDRAYLTDFGLALWQSKDKTMGTAFGTPRYIAPEQALASETAVPQSDIYAMAVVLYEILTGDMLFRADTPMQIALSHISEPPPSPRLINPNVPESVEKEILKALAKDSKQRHQTAGEFIGAVKDAYANVEAALTQSVIPARPVSETKGDHPSTVIISDARTPVSQALRKSTSSPVPPKTRWPLVVLAFGILTVALIFGGAMIGTASRERRVATENAQTAEAEQGLLIAALSATHTPTDTLTATLTGTPTSTFTATDEPTATDTATDEPTVTDAPTKTETPQDTETPEASATTDGSQLTTEARQSRATDRAAAFAATQEAAQTATDTDTPTATDTPHPPTPSPTRERGGETPTDTATDTDTPEPTDTDAPEPTDTDAPTASNTRPPTMTNTRRPSPTPQPTDTATRRPTATPTETGTEVVIGIDVTPSATVEPVELSLRYDLSFFVVRTESDADADVSELTFNAEGLAPQRLGGSLPLTTLPSGRCTAIHQTGRIFDAADYECPEPVERLTQIPASAVFWRGTSGTFEVRQDGEVLAECPVATRTEPQTCDVTLH